MDNDIYNLRYNVTGDQRKKLVKALSTYLHTEATYLGAPSFGYQVGKILVDRNGTVCCPTEMKNRSILAIVTALSKAGFPLDEAPMRGKDRGTPKALTELAAGLRTKRTKNSLTITVPAQGLSETARANLELLVAAKGNLIRHALGTSEVPVNISDSEVSFPWFSPDSTEEEIEAYSFLITGLVSMAKDQKHITAKEKEIVNEKYAFRCFLLRLGFIGTRFKSPRKVLLSKLNGNSAFRDKGTGV